MNGANVSLLEAREVVAGYLPGVDILHGSSFVVGDGEIVGIIGPNGAGKSTLLKAMFGLVPVRTGRCRCAATTSPACPPHELVKRGVGYVPQVRNVFATLTVEDNLRMGCYLRPTRVPRAARPRSSPCCRASASGCNSAPARSPAASARCSRWRARSMMEPSVLLLDEPSAGLSPMMQDDVFDRIVGMNAAGVSVLMVEQNARRCLEIADRGYVLDQGRNAYTGTGAELLADPKVIELYLGTLAQVD